MIQSILIGLACFFAFLITHVIVFRLIRLKERFRALFYIFLVFVPVYVFLYSVFSADYLVLAPIGPVVDPKLDLETVYKITRGIYFASGLALYLFLFLGYCQFYFIVDRSISVRVMLEIERSQRKMLTPEEIQKAYTFNEILSRRLGHLVEGKYLINKGGYYQNSGKGRFEARLFNFLKELLNLGKGG